MRVMLRLVGLVRPLMGFMVLAILMGLLGHVCAAAITVLGGYGVLTVLADGAAAPLAGLVVAMAVCAVARGLLRYGEQACNHFIAFKLLALVRDRVFQALRRLAPARLEGRDRGDLISLTTSDIELLEVFYAHTISPAAIALLFCAGACAFIGSFHPALAVVAAASYLAVGVACPLVAARLAGDAGARFRAGAGELSSFVLESLRGLDEILQYGAGAERLAQMDERSRALAADEERMKRSAGRATALTNTVILACDLVMLLVAAALHRAGAVSFDGAAASHVSFSYGDERVLTEVSLAAPASQIVGSSSRRLAVSTLLRLFMRFWDADEGSVSVSGRDVRHVDTANLRELESLVTQETHLFHDNIRNNLCIARLDATDEEIEAACRKASVHDFVMSLPAGYDTPVGELGDTLSGGERQRLGLARAFLHDAPFMLLDEPTSNLDSLNEAVILRSIAEERAGRTVLLVSHRPSTMRIADTVVNVEDGRVS